MSTSNTVEEGDLLLSGHDGQGQLHRDGLRVKGDQSDIKAGDKQGGRHEETSAAGAA